MLIEKAHLLRSYSEFEEVLVIPLQHNEPLSPKTVQESLI